MSYHRIFLSASNCIVDCKLNRERVEVRAARAVIGSGEVGRAAGGEARVGAVS